MKKGYWVVAYREISDEGSLREYSKLALPVVQAHGGKVLVRASAAESHEAGLTQRTVIIEFDSLEKAISAYHSDAYKLALKALGSGAERDFRIVEGVG